MCQQKGEKLQTKLEAANSRRTEQIDKKLQKAKEELAKVETVQSKASPKKGEGETEM